MPESIIECQNLWHVYPGGVIALQQANLTIHRGEIVGIIGQNGSGKTTLVKHFNGLLKPTQGKVLVKGMDTTPMRVQQLATNVGYVFQNPNHQLFAKTVQEELEFGPRNLGVSQEEVVERREKAIEFFNLQELRNQHPYRISFPLRKLVGMASIYTMRPEVFILDEPTTGQDNITTRIVYRLIHRLRDEGATIICVAHDMILLAEVVERMVVLRNSLIIEDTTPRKVFSNHDLMGSTHLTPPQIADLTLRLTEKQKMDGLRLSVDETIAALDHRMGTQRLISEVKK